MEGLPQLFLDLYNKFLLRDLFGKIVPGAMLVFLVLSLYEAPLALLARMVRARILMLVFFLGISWIVMLGVQCLAEVSGNWKYFPQALNLAGAEDRYCQKIESAREIEFCSRTMRVAEFTRCASETEKLQYERFVVIKEATGNLFSATVLCLPIVALHALRKRYPRARAAIMSREVLVSVYTVLLMVGLALMHRQHVTRQYMHADALVAQHERLRGSSCAH